MMLVLEDIPRTETSVQNVFGNRCPEPLFGYEGIGILFDWLE
jgi:hypothetical protein